VDRHDAKIVEIEKQKPLKHGGKEETEEN